MSKHKCRICNSEKLFAYFDLGAQPPSNAFLLKEQIPAEKKYPLSVALCRDCGLSQLTYVVPAESIFDEYAYLSSASKALCAHYQQMVDFLIANFSPANGSLVVDIGCNDGITLACYPKGVFRAIGVDPSSAGQLAVGHGFEVVRKFFGHKTALEMVDKYGKAKLVTATNVFAHQNDIRDFSAGISELLDKNGICCFEFPYVGELLNGLYFDTIYHEHLNYLGLSPLVPLFDSVGLKAISVERQSLGASGPAIRLCVAKANSSHAIQDSIPLMLREEASWIRSPEHYVAFADKVSVVRAELLQMVEILRSSGAKIGAYGAPAKGNTLLNYLGLDARTIIAIAENNKAKIGKFTPGTHIPIVSDDAYLALGTSHALLLSWNYADFFIANSEFVRRGGKFIVPLPVPHIAP